MKYIYSFALFILLFVIEQNVIHGGQSQAVHQILIDKLTSDYIELETDLWKKINTQQILIDRGNLLNEIYRQHNRTVNDDFDDSQLIWSLGIQKNQRLVSTTVAIDTNFKNVQHYLTNAEYPKLVDLATSATTNLKKLMADFFEAMSDRQFWNDILSNVNFREICFLSRVNLVFKNVFYLIAGQWAVQ